MNTDSRLVSCFQLVRPELSLEKILALSEEEMKSWDSIILVTLFSVVEEEFKIKIDSSDFEKLLSFTALKSRVSV